MGTLLNAIQPSLKMSAVKKAYGAVMYHNVDLPVSDIITENGHFCCVTIETHVFKRSVSGCSSTV